MRSESIRLGGTGYRSGAVTFAEAVPTLECAPNGDEGPHTTAVTAGVPAKLFMAMTRAMPAAGAAVAAAMAFRVATVSPRRTNQCPDWSQEQPHPEPVPRRPEQWPLASPTA